MDASAWDERYRAKDFVWSVEPNQFVAERCADLDPLEGGGNALDLAAGEGRNAVWLATLGWRVTAVDFSAVGLEKAQALAAQHDVTLETVLADLTEWNPTGDTYDLVLMAYLQVNEAVLAAVLPNATAAVRAGGRLLVVAHHPDNIQQGWGGPPSLEVLYGPERITSALPGWDILEAGRLDRPVETEDGVKNALDTVVFAQKTVT